MLREYVNHKFGKIICNYDDKNIEVLKIQCEKIIENLSEVFLLKDKKNIKFDLVINNDELSIPTFLLKGKEKIIQYPKRNLDTLHLEEYCPDLLHEIIHVIWFCKENIFLSEGIAVGISYYLSKKMYYPFQIDEDGSCLFQSLVSRIPKDVYVYLKLSEEYLHTRYLSTQFKQGFEISQQNLYAVAGSFIIFLIENYGIEKLGKLLSQGNISLSDIYTLSEKQLLTKWINSSLEIKDAEHEDKVSSCSLNLMNYTWTFADDSLIGGNSKIFFKKENDEISFKGRIGSGAPFNGGIVGVVLKNQSIDFSKYKNLTIEFNGTNIECQIIALTQKHKNPGREPMYMLQCKEEFSRCTIPLDRFRILSDPSVIIDSEDLVAVCCRVINKPGTKFEITIKNLYLS